MKSNPLVSIIIPTYNRAHLIGRALRSVLSQDYKNFEIIIIDDGSTDNTESVVNGFGENFIFIKQENRGRSYARNVGLKIAKGAYIAFLDSDDEFLPTKLSATVGYLERNADYGMVYTSAYCCDELNNYLKPFYEASVSGWIYTQIAFYVPVTITLPTVVVRREVLDSVGYFDERMDRFEDTDLWRRISKHTKIYGMKEFTCKLLTHKENSLSSQSLRGIEVALDYYVSKIRRDDFDVYASVFSAGASALYFHYAKAIIANGVSLIGLRLLAKACRYSPLLPVRVSFKYIKRKLQKYANAFNE